MDSETKPAPTKPGWKTTEASLAMVCGGSIYAIAQDSTDWRVTMAACGSLAIIAVAYLWSRTKAKAGVKP